MTQWPFAQRWIVCWTRHNKNLFKFPDNWKIFSTKFMKSAPTFFYFDRFLILRFPSSDQYLPFKFLLTLFLIIIQKKMKWFKTENLNKQKSPNWKQGQILSTGMNWTTTTTTTKTKSFERENQISAFRQYSRHTRYITLFNTNIVHCREKEAAEPPTITFDHEC